MNGTSGFMHGIKLVFDKVVNGAGVVIFNVRDLLSEGLLEDSRVIMWTGDQVED